VKSAKISEKKLIFEKSEKIYDFVVVGTIGAIKGVTRRHDGTSSIVFAYNWLDICGVANAVENNQR
jgi:hypothetical protein